MRKFCLIDAKCNRSDSVVADCFLRTSYVLSDQDVYARLFIHSFVHSFTIFLASSSLCFLFPDGIPQHFRPEMAGLNMFPSS